MRAERGPACPFCAIARGEEAAARVLEEPGVLAFLDQRPLFPGHCLVIPREHVETLLELPAERAPELLEAVRRLAAAMEQALGAEGSFVAINNRVSQSVPHLHVHVVPRRRKDGLRGFFWPRGRYAGPEQIEQVRTRLAAALARSPVS